MVRPLLLVLLVLAVLAGTAAAQPANLKEEQDYAFALGLFNDGNYQMSLVKFREFLTNWPRSELRLDAEYYVAESLFQNRNLSDAAIAFARFQKEHPESKLADDAGFREGEVYFRQGHFQKAFEQFSFVVRTWPRGNLAHEAAYWAGESAFKQDHHDDALRYYRIAYDHYPDGRIRDYAYFSTAFVRENQSRHEEALEIYESFLSLFPESALRSSVFTRIGACLFRLGRYQDALAWFDSLTDSPDPDNAAKRLFLRAESHFKLALHNDAESLYHSFLQAYPDNIRARQVQYALGWTQMEQHKYSEAIATFDDLSSKGGEIAEAAAFRKGVALRLNGNLESARTVFREIIQHNPKGSFTDNAHFELGMADFNEQSYVTAEGQFRSVTSQFLDSDVLADAWYMLGETQLKLRKFADAVHSFAAAQATTSVSPETLSKAMFRHGYSLYHSDQYKDAVIVLKNFLQRFPSDAFKNEALVWLGESHFKADEFDEAVVAYSQAIAETQDAALLQDALYGLGWAHFRNQNFAESEKAFRRLTTEHRAGKHDVDANVRLGDALYAQRRFEDAAKTYRYTARMYANNALAPYALLQLASSEHRSGQTPSSISTLRALLERYPDSEYADKAQFSLAWMYFVSKDFDTAIKEFDELVATWPTSPLAAQAKYSIADCHYNKGAFDDAANAYKRVLEEHPDSRIVSDALDGLAQTLRMQGKEQEAARVKADWLAANPRGEVAEGVAFAEARTAAEQSAPNSAIPVLQRFIAAHPSSSFIQEAYLLLGRAFRQNGDLTDAEHTLRETIRLDATTQIALVANFDLIETLMLLQKRDEALRLCGELLDNPKARPHRSRLFYRRGIIYRSNKLFQEARKDFEAAIQAQASDDYAVLAEIEMSVMKADEGQLDEALSRLGRIATSRVDAVGAEAQYRIGDLLINARRHGEAEEALLRVGYVFADAAPWNARALLLLGRLYEEQEKTEKARDMYSKVLTRFSGSDEARESSRRLEMLR